MSPSNDGRWNRLFEARDGSSLAFFRVTFGLVMVWSSVRMFLGDTITRDYLTTEFHFTYYGFSWVKPLPAGWLHAVAVIQGLAAAGIALGWRYRACAATFFVCFTYFFLLEQAEYLNHHYLICLVALLLVFIPAHRTWSLDVRAGRTRAAGARLWTYFLLRAQLGIVYTYAAVAKLNADWLGGEPMRAWLAERTHFALVGPLFDEEWVVLLFSYGGLLIDLLAAPLLLWRPTRRATFAIVALFHLMNFLLFDIGVFPWLMIAATTVFFPADWPRRLRGVPGERPLESLPRQRRTVVLSALAVWLGLQLLIPLRHWLYPGDVAWTEEGHRFSWRMKLRGKAGRSRFVVRNRTTGEIRTIDAHADLTERQIRKMNARPDMILQYAHFLARRLRQRTGEDVEVRAIVRASLNGRPMRRLVDSSVDLAAVPRDLGPADWIVRHDD